MLMLMRNGKCQPENHELLALYGGIRENNE